LAVFALNADFHQEDCHGQTQRREMVVGERNESRQ
ncbi:MAG: hypothetical protein ACI9G1_003675, partial [Pirellulaceae bacterium]